MRNQLLMSMLCVLSSMTTAHAAEANANEAQAMVKKAVAFLGTAGKQKALEEFNKPQGQFIDRDLYIFVLDAQGTTLANGVNAKIVGKNVATMADADGKNFIQEILKEAGSKGNAWVDYKWPDPVSKQLRKKSTYCEKASDLFLCSGIYK